jgi:hypothetical protein
LPAQTLFILSAKDWKVPLTSKSKQKDNREKELGGRKSDNKGREGKGEKQRYRESTKREEENISLGNKTG